MIDQLFPGAATVAEHLGVPYASLANAVVCNQESSVPPPTLSWLYSVDDEAMVARNEQGWQQIARALAPWLDAENAQRKLWNLPSYRNVLQDKDSYSQRLPPPAMHLAPSLQSHRPHGFRCPLY